MNRNVRFINKILQTNHGTKSAMHTWNIRLERINFYAETSVSRFFKSKLSITQKFQPLPSNANYHPF